MSLGIPPPYERTTTTQPTVTELQQTAQEEVSKMRLGVVPHDLLIPFEQMQRDTTWKYRADGGHPSLLPMGILRGAGRDIGSDDSLEGHYLALVNVLPEDVQEELAKQNRLTPEEKNPLFFALEMTVRWLAFASQFIKRADKSAEKEAVANEAALNRAIPSHLYAQAQLLVDEEAEHTKKVLEEVLGSNHPETEEILHDWNELMEIIK